MVNRELNEFNQKLFIIKYQQFLKVSSYKFAV